MLPLKRYIEMVVMFIISYLLMINTTAWWLVYTITGTVINVAYIICAKTVLPLMKYTIPKFFGDFQPFSTLQMKLCAAYVACLWLPAVQLLFA